VDVREVRVPMRQRAVPLPMKGAVAQYAPVQIPAGAIRAPGSHFGRWTTSCAACE